MSSKSRNESVDYLISLALGLSDPSKPIQEQVADETPSEAEEDSLLNAAERFVLDCGVEKGEISISNPIIWATYLQYSVKHPPKHRVNRDTFFKQFIKLFRQFRQGERFYYLNAEPFQAVDKWAARRILRDAKEKQYVIRSEATTQEKKQK